jgi:hypothetical protein
MKRRRAAAALICVRSRYAMINVVIFILVIACGLLLAGPHVLQGVTLDVRFTVPTDVRSQPNNLNTNYNMEATMKQTRIIIAALTIVMLLSVPTISEARLNCKESVLQDCIANCKGTFGSWNPLAYLCIDGCYIGCVTASSVD